ncbi:hypothetical protein LJE06_17515, partial [Bilophila wadsworthia]|uniref:hypothetical protein n=2 Tax=Bilophila wadsworthia TaxID=35833 RepID=UPI001D0A471E
QGLVGVSPWEFNSPLRHHKKINGLEGIFFLLARFLFSSAAILPHYAPTFGKLPKKFCLSAWQSSRLLRGKSSTHIAFLIGKLLMGVLTERLRGAFLFSQHPPSSFFVSSKKIRPPPVLLHGRRAGCRMPGVVGGSHDILQKTEPAARSKNLKQRKRLEEIKAPKRRKANTLARIGLSAEWNLSKR